MRSVSRRQWFTTLGGVLGGALEQTLPAESRSDAQAPVPIGRLQQYPPGSQQLVNHGQQLVRSLSGGLQAQDISLDGSSSGPVRPLLLERDGTLWLSPAEEWPASWVLSPLTGAPYPLEEDSL